MHIISIEAPDILARLVTNRSLLLISLVLDHDDVIEGVLSAHHGRDTLLLIQGLVNLQLLLLNLPLQLLFEVPLLLDDSLLVFRECRNFIKRSHFSNGLAPAFTMLLDDLKGLTDRASALECWLCGRLFLRADATGEVFQLSIIFYEVAQTLVKPIHHFGLIGGVFGGPFRKHFNILR